MQKILKVPTIAKLFYGWLFLLCSFAVFEMQLYISMQMHLQNAGKYSSLLHFTSSNSKCGR